MKKGLLSILAGALVVVGCQNYDDQFDNLESQISALASTVAGLSQVQSDLSALANTVANVQSALASIPSAAEINSAVSDGLAGVQSDIETLESALDNVVSADDLNTVSEAIDDVAEDVSDILASNNVYSQKLVITNQAELDIAMGLGGKIALINNDVEITLDEEMNRADLDSIASRITAVVGAFTYDGDNEDFESNGLTFSKLKSVSKKLVWKTRDDISFPALGSVGSLEIETGDSELITSASFPVLTKMPYVSTKVGTAAAAANTINLADATSLNLASITRYSGAATASQRGVTGTDGTATTASNALTITLDDDDDTTADLSALTTEDKDDAKKDVALALTLNGPRTVTLLNYAKGALVANNATTVTLPDYEWNASASFDEVVTLAVHKVAADMTLSLADYPDLESLDIRNAAYTVKNPAEIDIDISGNTNIETLNVDGYFTSIDATGTSSLENITTAGEVGTFKLTASDVDELTLGHAAWGTAGGYPTATLEVKDNTKITSITADSLDDITQLSIVNNDKLATISMAALTAPAVKATASATAGTPGRTPAVGILLYGNAKLTATHQKASAAGAITTVAQTVTLDQVPTSVVTWVKAAKAVWGTTGYGAKGTATQADGTFYIAVDEHTEVDADGDETEKDGLVIANLFGAATSNGGGVTYAKRTFNIGAVTGNIKLEFDTDNDGTMEVSAVQVASQGTLLQTMQKAITDASALITSQGVTMSVASGGDPSATIDFIDGANASATSLTIGDLVYVTIGGNKFYSSNGSATVTSTLAFEIGQELVGTASYTAGFGSTTPSATTIGSMVTSLTAALNNSDAVGDDSQVHAGTASSTAGANSAKIKDNTSTQTSLKVIAMDAADSSLNGAGISITVKRKPTSGDYSTVASWTALPLWKKEVYAVTSTLTINNEDAYYQINGTNSTADDTMTGTDVILTLTDTVGGSLSSIGQPMDDEKAKTGLTLAGIVSISHSSIGSGTYSELTGSQNGAGQTAANLKTAMGLGANAATPATAAAKKAAISLANQGGFVPSTTAVKFGQDAVTNTAAGAGTTPDLISKLAGI